MDEIQEYIAEIQEEADLLCSELGNMTRKDANISNEKINELIKIGLSISIKCSELLD